MAEVYKDIHKEAIITLHKRQRKPLAEEGLSTDNKVKLSTYQL
jgi:hypothetical protein